MMFQIFAKHPITENLDEMHQHLAKIQNFLIYNQKKHKNIKQGLLTC